MYVSSLIYTISVSHQWAPSKIISAFFATLPSVSLGLAFEIMAGVPPMFHKFLKWREWQYSLSLELPDSQTSPLWLVPLLSTMMQIETAYLA